jgi:hypothetical protein
MSNKSQRPRLATMAIFLVVEATCFMRGQRSTHVGVPVRQKRHEFNRQWCAPWLDEVRKINPQRSGGRNNAIVAHCLFPYRQ